MEGDREIEDQAVIETPRAAQIASASGLPELVAARLRLVTSCHLVFDLPILEECRQTRLMGAAAYHDSGILSIANNQLAALLAARNDPWRMRLPSPHFAQKQSERNRAVDLSTVNKYHKEMVKSALQIYSFRFGRDDQYWYWMENHFGRYNLVQTVVKDPVKHPKHLLADEKVTWLNGEEVGNRYTQFDRSLPAFQRKSSAT